MKLADRGAPDATLLRLVRANVREPNQLVGDLHALMACNQIGVRRLLEMMSEYALRSLDNLSDFILTTSKRATVELIRDLPNGTAGGHMRIDGYSTPIDLRTQVAIKEDRITCDWTGTSPVDPKGINVPLVYTKGLCLLRAEMRDSA